MRKWPFCPSGDRKTFLKIAKPKKGLGKKRHDIHFLPNKLFISLVETGTIIFE
jgi:hypothetical protein